MTDEIKSRKDLSLQPQDLAQSYVEPSFNQGSTGLSQIVGNTNGSLSAFESPVFHPGALGGRTTPGDGGFAYADTPQSSIFIQKKEWIEQEWVYVTDDDTERKGKIQEELMKVAYAKLIARKLDLLNEHELMTKFSDSSPRIAGMLQNAAGGVQTSLQFGQKLNPNQLADLLTSAGNPVSKYYTESIILKDPDDITPATTPKEIKGEFTFQIAKKVTIQTQEKGVAGRLRVRISPNSSAYLVGIKNGTTVTTTGKVINGTVVRNVAVIPNNLPSPEADVLKSKYPLESWWEIDLNQLDEAQLIFNDQAGSGDQTLDSLDKVIQASNGGKGYIPRYNPNNKNEQYTIPVEPYEEVKETIVLGVELGTPGKTTPGKVKKVYQNVFNGVIELANISNISTSINNKGNPGSASFELENPNNLLTISDDDIEIALGTYDIQDENLYTSSTIETNHLQLNKPQNIIYTDPATKKELTLYKHNGKFYTQHAYELVTNTSLGAMANFSTSGEIVKLKQHLAEIEAHITNLSLYKDTGKLKLTSSSSSNKTSDIGTQDSFEYNSFFDNNFDSSKYPNIESVPSYLIEVNFTFPPTTSIAGIPTEQYDLGFVANKEKVTNKIQALTKHRAGVLDAINQLSAPTNVSTFLPSDPDIAYRRSQLRKYFLNKTIFEVYDRVYIWMSSPSRTTFRLEDGTLVAEAASMDLSQQLLLQKIQQIISLIKQLNNTITKIAQQAKKPMTSSFSAQDLQSINDELFNTGKSPTYDNKSKQILDAFNSAPTLVDEAANFIKSLINSSNTPTPDPTIGILNSAIKQKITELGELKDNTPTEEDNKTISENVGSFDLSILDQSKFPGTDEQQIQVFQGVITKISRHYSNGQFKISITCEDNLNFLSRSRFTIRPALQTNFRQARAELDDPIYREVRNKPATDQLGKDTSVDKFTGRWKTGVLATSANVLSSKDEDLYQKSQAKGQTSIGQPIPETERIKAGLPNTYAFIEPFLGADPATIISLLVTGLPFDVPNYILNTAFGGSFNKKAKDTKDKDKDGEIQPSGPIENVRTQILGQLRRFGDFEPFIDQKQTNNPKISDQEKKNINEASATRLAAAIIAFARVYIQSRKDVLASAYQTVNTGLQNKNSIWSEITTSNYTTILNNSDVLPTNNSQITINPNVLGDGKLDFFVKAAIKGIQVGDINKAIVDQDNQKLSSFVSGTSNSTIQEIVKQPARFQLTQTDSSVYLEIIDAVNSRIRRGVFFKTLAGNKDEFKDLLKPKTLSEQDLALHKVVAQLRGVELDQDGRFIVAGSPLQATKPSIMFKQKNNYLVVSDEYFKSPNLIDYVEKISNPAQHFIDDYKNVITRCKDAAVKIDWEFYADSQGHIRFKEPTYNRTLLKHLLELNSIDSVLKSTFQQLFKDYELNAAQEILVYKIFVSSLEQAKNQALTSIQNLIVQASQLAIPQNMLNVESRFGLSTSPLNVLEYILKNDLIPRNRLRQIRALIKLNGLDSGGIDSLKKQDLQLTSQDIMNKAKNIIENTTITSVNNTFAGVGIEDIVPKDLSSNLNDSIQTYITELNTQAQGLLDTIASTFTGGGLDPETVSQDISDGIEDYVSAVLLIIDAINNLKTEIAKLEGTFANALQDITDEKYIHVITNAIIIDEHYSEDAPHFTRLDVYAQGAVPTQGQFPSEKENEQVLWAGAVDYDLYRIYGYVGSEKIEAPFLKTSGQAVLYAFQLMARQYSKILNGSITVRGDSKYQLGDTVFIEDENIYYYITEVTHNFTYGGEYKTNLKLEYGRRPGYYIPYPFNILGSRLTSAINRLYSTDNGDISQIIKQFNLEQQAKLTQAGK